jgi:MFS family permease
MTRDSYHTDRDVPPASATRAPMFALATAGALCGLDAGSFGPCLPALRAGLALDDQRAAWILSAYVLGAIYGAPWAAWFGATRGASRTLVGALLVAAAGAFVMATAPDLAAVCVGRALFGFGGGAVLPMATAVVTARVAAEGRGRAIVTLSLAYGLAFVAASVGAAAVGALAWRAVYVGLGAFALVAAVAVVGARGDGRAAVASSLDGVGVAWWSVTVAALAVVVPRLRGASGDALPLAVALVVAGLSLGAAAWRARATAEPFVPFGLLRDATVRGACALAFGMGAGQVFAVSIPSFAAVVVGAAPARVGLWSLPFVVAGLVGTALAAVFIDRLGARRVVAVTGAALVLGAAALGLTAPSPAGFLTASAVVGAGLCTLSAGPIRRLVAEGAEADAARTQSLLGLVTNLGLLAGSALYGALVSPRAEAAHRAAGMRAATLALALLVAAALALGGWALRRATRARAAV